MGRKRTQRGETKESQQSATVEELSTARGRFKTALDDVVKGNDLSFLSADELDDDSDIVPIDDDLKFPTKPKRNSKVRRSGRNKEVAYEHTYVMKLYDRSVDLAQFNENTPLYPICRAWMANKPKIAQNSITKTIVKTSDPICLPIKDEDFVNELPKPKCKPIGRIPSPIPEQKLNNSSKISFDYTNSELVSKEKLLEDHLVRWTKVRNKWIEASNKNEERFSESAEILNDLFKQIN